MILQDRHWLSFNKIITLFYMKTDRFVITRVWHSFVQLYWRHFIFMFGNKLKNVLSNGDCWYIRNNRLNNSIIAITLWHNIRHEKCGGRILQLNDPCRCDLFNAIFYSNSEHWSKIKIARFNPHSDLMGTLSPSARYRNRMYDVCTYFNENPFTTGKTKKKKKSVEVVGTVG